MPCDGKRLFTTLVLTLRFIATMERKYATFDAKGYYWCEGHQGYHLTAKWPDSKSVRDPEMLAIQIRRDQGYLVGESNGEVQVGF